jgi:hypothetical protein
MPTRVKTYRDRLVQFSYPANCTLQANPAAGNYAVARKQELSADVSVLEPAILAGVFESMAKAAAPADRKKTTFENYRFGDKVGRAIEWTVPDADGGTIANSLDFFFELPPLSVAIKIIAWVPASVEEFQDFVSSLTIARS